MKFSLMTYTMWPELNSGKMGLLDVLRFSSELGFDAVEFSISDFARESDAEIKQTLTTLGLEISCINGTFSLAAKEQKKFNKAILDAKMMVDIANCFHCERIMYVPALASDIDGFADKARAADRIAEALREIVDYALAKQITVTVEDFPRLLYPLSTIDEVQYMLDSVPGLRLTFDNGNFLPGGDDLMNAYDRFKDYIENVHIKDWELAPDTVGVLCHDGRIIRGGSHGKGLLDHTTFLRALKNAGYSKYLALEYEGILDHAEETKKGFEYLKSLIN